MIKILLIVVFCGIAFYLIVGRKIVSRIRASSERRFKQEQQRAAWREGYQAEKIKISIEQGRAAARAEELQPTLDLRQIDSPQKMPDIKPAILNFEKVMTKEPNCKDHNFTGKNWLDYARHIRKYHKKK